MIDDGSGYWRTMLSDPFRQVARKLGVRIAGAATFDPEARSVAALADRVERSGAQGVLIGAHPFGASLDLVKAVRARLGTAPRSWSATPSRRSRRTRCSTRRSGLRGVYVATLDVPRTVMPLTAAAGASHVTSTRTQRGVLEAAQATELVLAAIAGSDGTRASVLARLRASKVRDGILGSFRFDRNGDMTPGWVPILRFTRPDPGNAKQLSGAAVRPCRAPPDEHPGLTVRPMEFRLLGPLEVLEHEHAVALGAGKQRSLFALLLLHANEIVSTDRLIDALWGATPPPTAAKTVQVYVSRLRKELGDGRLLTRPPGYALQVSRSELDLARFEQLLDEARRSDPGRAARDLAAGAGPVARTGARRPGLRGVRAARDRAARRAALGSARAADRRRSRRGPRRRADRRAGRARRRASAPGATALPADAGALSLGAPSRGARRIPPGAARALRRARARAGRGAAGSSSRPSCARTRRSISRGSRHRRRRSPACRRVRC